VAAQLETNEPLARRLRQRVEDLDVAIRRIRTSIYALRGDVLGRGAGVRQSILTVVGAVAPALGFAPSVSFAGLLDIQLPEDLTNDVTAVVRETLTNVAKHAHASSAALDVKIIDDRLTVTVSDDGDGVVGSPRASGIDNLRVRAARHGGSFSLAPAPGGGSIATWMARTPPRS